MTIYDAFLSLYRTIKEVAGINLNSRFVRVYIKYDTSFRRFESSTFLRNMIAIAYINLVPSYDRNLYHTSIE